MLKLKNHQISEQKKSLLEAIFSTNYDKQKNQENSIDKKSHYKEEDYSPGFKNLVGRDQKNSWRTPMRNNSVYESAKVEVASVSRIGSILRPQNGDYGNRSADIYNESSSKAKSLTRSQSYKSESSPIRMMAGINSRRYIAEEDRTFKLKYKVQMKRYQMKNDPEHKAITLRKRVKERPKNTEDNEINLSNTQMNTYDLSLINIQKKKRREMPDPSSVYENGFARKLSQEEINKNIDTGERNKNIKQSSNDIQSSYRNTQKEDKIAKLIEDTEERISKGEMKMGNRYWYSSGPKNLIKVDKIKKFL